MLTSIINITLTLVHELAHLYKYDGEVKIMMEESTSKVCTFALDVKLPQFSSLPTLDIRPQGI
ncbi:MAG: hypothetical protein ACP5NV_04850 [Candidatus Woesearchaeota archaeon]